MDKRQATSAAALQKASAEIARGAITRDGNTVQPSIIAAQGVNTRFNLLTLGNYAYIAYRHSNGPDGAPLKVEFSRPAVKLSSPCRYNAYAELRARYPGHTFHVCGAFTKAAREQDTTAVVWYTYEITRGKIRRETGKASGARLETLEAAYNALCEAQTRIQARGAAAIASIHSDFAQECLSAAIAAVYESLSLKQSNANIASAAGAAIGSILWIHQRANDTCYEIQLDNPAFEAIASLENYNPYDYSDIITKDNAAIIKALHSVVTPLQWDVCIRLANGYNITETAARLNITRQAVQKHIRLIRVKLYTIMDNMTGKIKAVKPYEYSK